MALDVSTIDDDLNAMQKLMNGDLTAGLFAQEDNHFDNEGDSDDADSNEGEEEDEIQNDDEMQGKTHENEG